MSPYGCHNRPRPTTSGTHVVRGGYREYWHPEYEAVVRDTKWVAIQNVMSTDCQYTQRHANDPKCAGCMHRAKG